MQEEQKVLIDVAAGSGTFAAWIGMAPDFVAVLTGVWVVIRIIETETVRKLMGRD
jgi:adenine/guanine phosphoribosyltransferase-like PRPP-binding protein